MEHMIPRSMGGAGHFLCRLVCNDCNHKLGQVADTICDEHPFVVLRFELGLVDQLPTTYRRAGLDTDIQAVVNSRGELIDTRRVYEELGGKQYTILGKTKNDVEETAAKIAAKKRIRAIARGEKPPELVGKAEFSAAGVALNSLKGDADAMKLRLQRFAAKVAMEYIGRVTEVCMDVRLDDLRNVAIVGGAIDGFRVVSIGGGLYWLPNTQETLLLTDNPELLNIEKELQPGVKHEGAATVAQFVHGIELDGRNQVFHLSLFSIIRISLPLPAMGLPSLPMESIKLPYVASAWRVLTA